MVCQTTPFECQEETDDGWEEEESADRIESSGLFMQRRRFALEILLGNMQEKDVYEQDDSSEGKIDVKAPTPTRTICERPSQQWAGGAGDAKNHPNEAHVLWSFVERDDVDNDNDRSLEEASVSQPGDSTANDQSDRVRGGAADGGTDLEDDQRAQVHPLRVVEGVDSSHSQQKARSRQEVRRAVPAYVAERVEVVSDPLISRSRATRKIVK